MRTILHVDLDAFYASVEQRDDPSLRGRPVIVGWPSRRGVVCAASYEARPSGVRSAMSMVEARQRCPEAVCIPPRMAHYAEVSRAFFGILEGFTPLVEGLSLDEAFLDVSGSALLFGDGVTIAKRIKEEVRRKLEIVASVGIAPVKFVAKIASDFGKPDGLLVVRPDEVLPFLHALPVGRLWGVGKVSEQQLRGLGFELVGDLAAADPKSLARTLGEAHAAHLLALARGDDPRSVVPSRETISVGHEETFDHDLRDRGAARTALLAQGDEACRRMRAHGLRARTITVKIKYSNHELITRRTTLESPTADGFTVGATVETLLERIPHIEARGIRLTGVSLSGLEPVGHAPQLVLPGSESASDAVAERNHRLADTLDALGEKFGRGTVQRAVHIGARGKPTRMR